MFSSSLRASLVALVASAVAVCAAPTATADVGVHLGVNVNPLGSVTITVGNNGGKTLKLLKDPRGVLDTFPEDTFTITDATGSRPSFNGAKVNPASGHLTKSHADAFGLHPLG